MLDPNMIPQRRPRRKNDPLIPMHLMPTHVAGPIMRPLMHPELLGRRKAPRASGVRAGEWFCSRRGMDRGDVCAKLVVFRECCFTMRALP